MNKTLLEAAKELIFGFGGFFIILLAVLFANGVISVLSVVSIIPLADFILDQNLTNPSKVTAIILWLGIVPGLLIFGVVFIFFNVVKGLFDILINYISIWIKYRVYQRLTGRLLHDILTSRWLFFVSNRYGDILNTLQREVMQTGTLISGMAQLVANIAQFGIYLAASFVINPQMTAAALIIAVVFSIPFSVIGRLAYRLGTRTTGTSNRIVAVVSEILTGVKFILATARQTQALKRFGAVFDENATAVKNSQALSQAVASFYQPLGITAAVTAMFYALNRGVPLAEVAAVLWALLKALPFIGMILKGKAAINNSLPSYEQVKRLREEAQKHKEISGDKKFSALTQEIALRNVSFSYPGRSGTLDRVNIRINRGEMTALVGESGCGKSTVADMVMGLLVPDSGEVQIDGLPLSKWDIASWRHGLGYVTQDEFIFHASIKDNLLWASEQAVTEDYLWQVCKTAHADEFIRDFPQGLKTIVGERGVRLSGGQRQRLALVRALINDPDILILDEATSSLDDKSEKYIQQAIERMLGKKTIIIIAHRLSTIRKADMVYVMGGGRVVEHGTYAELTTKADSKFAHMIAGQEHK